MNPLTTPTPLANCTLNGEPVPCDQVANAVGGLFLGLGVFFFIFFMLMMVVGIAALVFQILMIIHAAQNEIKDRALWIVIMVFTGGVGAVIYYFAVKRPFDEQQEQKPAKVPRRVARKPRKK